MSTRLMTNAVTALAGGVLDWQPANGSPRSQWLAACPNAAVPLHSLTPAPLHVVEDSSRLASSISAHLLMRGVAFRGWSSVTVVARAGDPEMPWKPCRPVLTSRRATHATP